MLLYPEIETELTLSQGLASSFMFSLGGAGLMVLDQTHNPSTPKINRMMLQVQNQLSEQIEIKLYFLACWIRVHGSELCLLLHLHEDEVAGLHAVLNLKAKIRSFLPFSPCL